MKTKKQQIVLPKNTSITKYFFYKSRVLVKVAPYVDRKLIFSITDIPDGRKLVMLEHTWGDSDGEVMNFGFQYSDGIFRSGYNPLHMVGIYDKPMTNKTLRRELLKFCLRYYVNNKSLPECAG